MGIFYLDPNKSQKEQSFFETFLSNVRGLHIQNWDRSEAPDYILYTSQGRIGLEVTALVLTNPKGQTPMAAIRAAQNNCLKKAAELAEQHSLGPVEVKVKFRSDLQPIDVGVGAKELVEFVKEKFNEIDDTRIWNYPESGFKYSKWISINLGTCNGHRWLSEYRFARMLVNWMRVDPVEEIQARIDEKQAKIKNYIQRCNECWLLIGVDEWTAPEAVAITEKLNTHKFSGDFRRLFFLRNIEGKLVELKIDPAQRSEHG